MDVDGIYVAYMLQANKLQERFIVKFGVEKCKDNVIYFKKCLNRSSSFVGFTDGSFRKN